MDFLKSVMSDIHFNPIANSCPYFTDLINSESFLINEIDALELIVHRNLVKITAQYINY